MPANTNPIFTISPEVQWGNIIKTANAARDGTGKIERVFIAKTAENSGNGSYLSKMIIRSLGTNIATVLRIFLNNGQDNQTATNNTLIGEMTLPAVTASEVSALPELVYPLNIAIPAGHALHCVVGTELAAGYHITVFGGSY